MDTARDVAARILFEIHEGAAYANVALDRQLKRQPLKELDRRLVTELVYGAAKAGDTLDWQLNRYLKKPLPKLPPMIREVLRLAFYQLFYLDKIPPSAVCNEAVNSAKKFGHVGTAGLVNACIRNAIRRPEAAAIPKSRTAANLALRYQHPRWLAERLVGEWGYEETAQFFACNNEPPPLSLRTNTLRLSREELQRRLSACGQKTTPSALAPEGLIMTGCGALENLSPLKEGLCQVQDESSMLVATVTGVRSGDTVIDVCAAPGGKATHLAALMDNHGRIIAGDIHEHKLRQIAENARRLGVTIIEPRLLDGRTVGERYAGLADVVLVDAPCSGLGVLRRRSDARWRKTADDIDKLAALQRELLASAALAVKRGGVLVYSTCTITHEENQDNVAAFLADNRDFTLEDAGSLLPKPRREMMVQLYPQRDGTDGFFIARMKKLS